MAKKAGKTAVKKAAGPGRPKLADADRRSPSSWIAISPREKQTLQIAADKAGKTLAVWAREILLAAAADG